MITNTIPPSVNEKAVLVFPTKLPSHCTTKGEKKEPRLQETIAKEIAKLVEFSGAPGNRISYM
ncbi:hypothetical protein SDC9_62176 [bioreactor metagenome]|uniref:Uncharacterized protein n=1 Tax=bioreactor metagenome TaxID=1076179 RepID=A0A644XNZ5_9ZZZZ